MFTVMTVIRKKPDITTEDFRHFMKDVYGRTYQEMPQTKSYVQYFLSDLATDGAEPPIDAIVEISFESEEKMREALQADSYHKAAKAREEYMRETSTGIHSALVDETNKMV
jgi:hypothetical protein